MAATATIHTRSIQGEALSGNTDALANLPLDEGVCYGLRANAFKVAAQASPNMTVRVGSGTANDRAVVVGDYAGQNSVICQMEDTAVDLTVSTAHVTYNRKDIVVLKVADSVFSGTDDYADVVVIKGVEDGSEVAPSVPSSSLLLATVQVNSGVSSITSGNITDERQKALTRTLFMRGIGSLIHLSATGNLTTGTWTKIPSLTARQVDPDNWYNGGAARWEPTLRGWARIDASITLSVGLSVPFYLALYKDGVLYKRFATGVGGSGYGETMAQGSLTFPTVVGSYYELYGYQASGVTRATTADDAWSWCSYTFLGDYPSVTYVSD